MIINPLYLKDFYKVSHHEMYPPGTTLLFSNFTPRKSRMPGVNHSVFFGLKFFINDYLNKIGFWCTNNAGDAREELEDYQQFMQKTLGNFAYPEHLDKLFRMPHLPIAIYALPEGAVVPCGVPALVMYNTHPDFYWLPGMLETMLSSTLWGMCTSATIAREYRLILDKYADETSDMPEFVDYQAHDFSMRGMFGIEAATMSGMAHLQYFKGTDCIPALIVNEKDYDNPLQISSVPATEHSVMSAGGKENELETYNRLLDVYPNGIISVVSDTWDLWQVVSDILPKLRDKIMSRDGKLVIRPDSGDPVEILCGLSSLDGCYEDRCNEYEFKGLIECLWDIFGGTINSKGFKQLDGHIGAIYGDSITLDRAFDICERLKAKGFASTNVVLGIGSYSYQYNTRDTLGWAMKCTYAEINGVGRAITKDPITDGGIKKSHSGLLKVVCDVAKAGFPYKVLQNVTWDEFNAPDNELKLVYKDGEALI